MNAALRFFELMLVLEIFVSGAFAANVAVTARSEPELFTLHVAAPEHAPVQPEKVEPAAGAAVSVIELPKATLVEQLVPQEMPAGALVTVPVPVPDFVTVTRWRPR